MSTTPTNTCSAVPLSQAPKQDFEVALSALGTFYVDKFCMYPPKDSRGLETPGRCVLTNSTQLKMKLDQEMPGTMVICNNSPSGRVCAMAREEMSNTPDKVNTICARLL